MSQYQYDITNRTVPQAVYGFPAYCFGSRDTTIADTVMNITNVARTGTTATVTVAVIAGNVPVAGQLVTVVCDNSNVNANQVALTTVTINATTGIGTIVYTTTGFGEVISVAATGKATAIVLEVGDALVQGQTSLQVEIPTVTGQEGHDVRLEVTIGAASGTPTATITPQESIIDVAAQYQAISTAATTALTFTGKGTQAVTIADFQGRFINFVTTAVGGGAGTPTIIARVLI